MIQENTIVTQKILSLKKEEGKKGLMAVKIDMENAFDYMEWNFLLTDLTFVRFHKNGSTG